MRRGTLPVFFLGLLLALLTALLPALPAQAQLWREVLDPELVAAPPLAERAPGQAVAASTMPTLDLATVVALALAHNPALRAEQERRWEVVGGVQETRAGAFPQLSAVADWGRSRNPSLLNSSDFEDFVDQFPGGTFVPEEQELYRVSVELTQPLYTWGRVGTALQLARTLVDVTDQQIEAARLDVAVAAARAYYELLALRQALDTVEGQRESRQAALAVVQARYDIGEATRLELLRAEASRSQVEPEVAAIRGDVRVAESRLLRLLGVTFAQPPYPELRLRPVDVDPPPPPPLDQLLELARAHRPEVHDLELQQRALDQRKTIVSSDGKPRLELTSAYGHSAREIDNLDDPLYRDWYVTIGMSWDFLDGGRRKGQLAQLDSQRLQLAWRQRDLELGIRLEVEEALALYEAALARWQAAVISSEAASEAHRVAQETYREGVALQVDLLDAQQLETDAELVRVQAYYGAFEAWAQLHRAVGRLPTHALDAASRRSEVKP